MIIKRKERRIKTAKGKVLYRRDLKLVKALQDGRDEYILTRSMIGLLGPWNNQMIKVADPSGNTFNERLENLRGTKLSKDNFYLLFQKTKAYERIAENKY